MLVESGKPDLSVLAAKTGLEERIWAAIIGQLAQFPDIEKAVLYGSRAKGNPRYASDIDLTLIGDRLTWQDFHRIEKALDDLLLPWKIDLSLYRHIENPELKDHVCRVGISIYHASA